MTLGLRIQWIFWVSLVVIVSAGVITVHLSSGTSIALELRPRASAVVTQFRPLPHALDLHISFSRAGWEDKRPELGDYQHRGNWKEAGFLEFPRPGAPIKLMIRGENSAAIYEALPSGSYNEKTKGRDLVPFVDDGNPSRFPWPPKSFLRPELPVGYSTTEISILEVGKELEGEQATLVVSSPVSFKSTAPGYGLFWWFMLWPLYLFLLVPYGATLFWMSVRRRVSNPEAASASVGSRAKLNS